MLFRSAADQLQTSPTLVQQTQARFGAYYTNFIQTRVEALVHDQQAQREMQSDLNNLRKSWQWAVDQTDIDALDKSNDGLFRFYFIKGMYQEGELAARAAVTALRKLLNEQSSTPDRFSKPVSAQVTYALARSLLTQARFCERLAHLEEAEQLTQEGIQEAQALGAVELEARGYGVLAAIAQIRQDNTTMRLLGEKMVALVAEGGFSRLEGIRVQGYGLKYQGIYGVYTGDYAQAAACFQQGLQLAQQIEDRELALAAYATELIE